MKKIMIVSTNADESGAPRHVEALIASLRGRYQFICVFGERGAVASRLCESGIEVVTVEQLRSPIRPFQDLVALVKLFRVVYTSRPDLIHCHSAKAGLLGRIVALALFIPSLYTVHGWGWRGMGAIKASLIKFSERILRAAGKSYYIYVAADVMHDGLNVVGISKGRGEVVYNGVKDMGSAISSPSTSEHIVLIMPARVCDAKDHSTLLNAFAQLPRHFKLILCGVGTRDTGFLEYAKKLTKAKFEDIEFLGEVADMKSLYLRSNVFVLASKYEALPLSIIEAMSCSLPIVASDVGGNGELVIDGRSGFLVPVKDDASLRDALLKLDAVDVRQEFGRVSRLRYLEKFTIEIMTNRVSAVYDTYAK